jgi:hypothetical protein
MKVFTNLFCSLTIIALLTLAASDAGASLIGHWTFDEGSGTTAYDSINGLNGAISNATYVDGHIGSHALNFNGIDSFVEVLNNSLLVPETIGISLWFKTSDPGYEQYNTLIDKGHGQGSEPYYAGYAITAISETSFHAVYGDGSGFYEAIAGWSWGDNNWHHLAVNLGNDGCQFYIDGVLQDSQPGSGPISQNNSNLYFGKHRNPTLGRFFQGAMDDIQIYDSPLSLEQVNALFVPEPATIGLLSLGALSLVRRKK